MPTIQTWTPPRLPESRIRDLLTIYGKRLEGEDETVLWHVIRDLVEFCEANGYDFDAIARDAKGFEL